MTCAVVLLVGLGLYTAHLWVRGSAHSALNDLFDDTDEVVE